MATRITGLATGLDIDSIVKTNAERAAAIAERTVRKVYKKVGFVERIR